MGLCESEAQLARSGSRLLNGGVLRAAAKIPGLRFCHRRGTPGAIQSIVCQQWSFSSHRSTSEVEDYQVDLDRVSVLELAIRPALTPGNAVATLDKWRVI
jgi:hypothetical protein